MGEMTVLEGAVADFITLDDESFSSCILAFMASTLLLGLGGRGPVAVAAAEAERLPKEVDNLWTDFTVAAFLYTSKFGEDEDGMVTLLRPSSFNCL